MNLLFLDARSGAERVALTLAAGAVLAGCATAPSERQPPVARAGALQQCEALAGSFSYASTRIASATAEAAGPVGGSGPALGAHCLVKGAMNERTGAGGIAYAVGFEMRLPREWNGRFWYQGNGGIDGSVVPAIGGMGGGPVTSALGQGFAVISSDAGHDNRLTKGPQFGLDPQSRLDYGYQAVGTLTPMAKALITMAYGRGPDTSYIGGCSNGGRHALVAAARHPQMFDGYLVGAPGYRLPLAAVANIYGAQQYKTVATDPKDLSTAFTLAERRTVVGRGARALRCTGRLARRHGAGCRRVLPGLRSSARRTDVQCRAQWQLPDARPEARNRQHLPRRHHTRRQAVLCGLPVRRGPGDRGLRGLGIQGADRA